MGKWIFSKLLKIKNKLSDSKISKIPGVEYLYKIFYKLAEPKGIILISAQGNKMYVNTRDKGIVPHLLTNGVWERYETDLFYKLIKPGDVVVDIGANIGYYTLIAAKIVGNEGKVYAFEPESDNYELLVKNIEINGYTNITPIKKALSNRKGNLKLFLNKTNLGGHSISDDNVPIRKGGVIEVETITLDDYFEKSINENRVDFIKMDTEGAEGLIIEGSKNILKNNNLKILMEFWLYGLKNIGTDPLELLSTLQDYGFKIKLLDETNRTLKIVENEKIIEICEKQDNGMIEVNLLLEK